MAQAQQHTRTHTNLTGPSVWTWLSESLRVLFSRRRPWLELLDRSTFSKPSSLSDATNRIRKNISYFLVNYLIVIASVLALLILYDPFSLLTSLAILAAWLFLYLLGPSDHQLVVLNRTFSDRDMLCGLISGTFFVIFMTNIGSLLMSATMIGVGIVSVHGAFRDPEDLFIDDQDLPGSGLFSYIKTAASSAGINIGILSVVFSSL